MAGLTRIRIRNFRSARDVTLEPGSLCALVGDVSAGKSTVLSAIALLLGAGGAAGEDDVTAGTRGPIEIEGELGDNMARRLRAQPPGAAAVEGAPAPPALYLPTAARSSAGSALAFLRELEETCAGDRRDLVVLIEEPELYLRPQAQRYLYRLLEGFARDGNQVIYSTHAPEFLNVARLEELALVSHDGASGTRIFQPEPPALEDEFEVVNEFDAERSELFLARGVVLVEGRTEKLALPFVFRALGHDVDRDGISIVECGGKSGIPRFARICDACRIPLVAVHDRDAAPGREPLQAERFLNELIESVVGPSRTVVLEPDFEAIAGLAGHSHKPERAWRHFAALAAADVPEPLARVPTRLLAQL
jgi:predicted ATP-dependent endonuclease of OLD family